MALTAKTFDTLLALVREHGRLVTKDRLLEIVWPDVTVEEGNLTYNISMLRKALGERRGGPRYVENVPRQGYRFVGEVTEHEAAPRSEGHADPFAWVVEREGELEALLEAARCAEQGQPQVRFVRGEAGTGKSTLVQMFAAQAAGREYLLATGECLEQRGDMEPYRPVLDALGTVGRSSRRELLAETLRVHAPTWLARMPWLSAGNEVVVSSGLSQERMLREIEEALRALAATHALVMALEDLHWCDAATLDFVARMAKASGPARLLLIGTYRPAEAKLRGHPIHALAQEASVRAPETVITLGGLSREGVAEHLARRFDGRAGEAMAAALHARTEGNPLFLHAMLQGQGPVPAVSEAPETLREFLQQQIAQLAPEHRDILEAAAVAHPHVWLRLMAAALDRPLEEVERGCESLSHAGHLLARTGAFEYANGEVEEGFAFTHNLHREVIYSRLAGPRRTRLHARSGAFLETACGSRPEGMAAALGRHFREGREFGRAIPYLTLAAQQALRGGAQREAIAALEEALRLAARLPPGEREAAELTVQAARAPALMALRGFADAEAEAAHRRALTLAQQAGSELRYPAAFGLAAMLEVRGEYAESQAVLESHLPERERQRQYGAEWRHLLACSTFHQAQFAVALEHARTGLREFPDTGHSAMLRGYGEHAGVEFHGWAGLALWFLGYPDQALEEARQAAALVEGPEYAYALANGSAQIALLHQLRREVEESLHYARATVDAGKRQGMPYRIAIGNVIHGWARAQSGAGADAVEEIQGALATCDRIGARLDRPYFLALLAESLMRLGEVDEAGAAIDEALRQVESARSFFYHAELLRLRACVLARRGEGAEAAFRRAVLLARGQSARSLELRALRSWVEAGGGNEALAGLRQAHGWFREGFDTQDLRASAQYCVKVAAMEADLR